MKSETVVSDVRKLLELCAAKEEYEKSKTILLQSLMLPALNPAKRLHDAILTANRYSAAIDAFRSLKPGARRIQAERIVEFAEKAGRSAAGVGGNYSGDTRTSIVWGDTPHACTHLAAGGTYSRKCTFRKSDATHVITFSPDGVIDLEARRDIFELSEKDGLPLIALYPDDSAVWVRTGRGGKSIRSERGWIASRDNVMFHSTKSKQHAEKGLAGKLKKIRQERQERINERKRRRREYLIASLCHSMSATIEDAKSLGFCEPGIKAFQAAHGIGDSASLPDLLKTGNANAVRLALHVARRVKPKRESNAGKRAGHLAEA